MKWAHREVEESTRTDISSMQVIHQCQLAAVLLLSLSSLFSPLQAVLSEKISFEEQDLMSLSELEIYSICNQSRNIEDKTGECVCG